jgi:hypothetical protein
VESERSTRRPRPAEPSRTAVLAAGRCSHVNYGKKSGPRPYGGAGRRSPVVGSATISRRQNNESETPRTRKQADPCAAATGQTWQLGEPMCSDGPAPYRHREKHLCSPLGGRSVPTPTPTTRHLEDKRSRRKRLSMKINDETEHAIAAYAGKVTRCRPGEARGDKPVEAKPGPDVSAGWQVPPPDESEQRRRQRMAWAKRLRIAERNVAVRKHKESDTRSTRVERRRSNTTKGEKR